MRRYVILLICIAAMMCIGGCAGKQEDYKYQVFYVSKNENELIKEGYNCHANDVRGQVQELLGRLASQPKDDDAIIPGLDISSIIGCEYKDEGNISLNFDSNYYTIPKIKETLCRAAIVKTLCQIDGVNGVEFKIDGIAHVDYSGNQIGYMSEETFVDNTSGETTYKQTISVNLYFADETGKKLVKVPTNVTFDGTISLEQLILQRLISGPDSIRGVDKSLQGVVSELTSVNQITVREQICYIDLNRDFLTSVEGVNREVSLYSVVNSLVELAHINRVQFTIDGETIKYYGNSQIVFDTPLERNLEIIKE